MAKSRSQSRRRGPRHYGEILDTYKNQQGDGVVACIGARVVVEPHVTSPDHGVTEHEDLIIGVKIDEWEDPFTVSASHESGVTMPFVLRTARFERESAWGSRFAGLDANTNSITLALRRADHQHDLREVPADHPYRQQYPDHQVWLGLEERCPICHPEPERDLVDEAWRMALAQEPLAKQSPRELVVEALTWIAYSQYMRECEPGDHVGNAAGGIECAKARLVALLKRLPDDAIQLK